MRRDAEDAPRDLPPLVEALPLAEALMDDPVIAAPVRVEGAGVLTVAVAGVLIFGVSVAALPMVPVGTMLAVEFAAVAAAATVLLLVH